MVISSCDVDLNAWNNSFYFDGLGDEFAFYTGGSIEFKANSNEFVVNVYLLEFYRELSISLLRRCGLKDFQFTLKMQLAGETLNFTKTKGVLTIYHTRIRIDAIYDWNEFMRYFLEFRQQLGRQLRCVFPRVEKTNEFKLLFCDRR